MKKVPVAIIGSGNIGTDLMIKILRLSKRMEVGAFVGIDPNSDGLQRAQRLNVLTTSNGIEGLLEMPQFQDIEVVFDATSAGSHAAHDKALRRHGKQVIDLTPAAIGPYVVPAVNLDVNFEEPNLNMVTCGGQATIPIVAAINRVSPVLYAEIVASISSKSAGPGTRANIDEYTETTARALERVGGAKQGKAIIVLNPAEPPLIMRDTVFCLCADGDEAAISAAVSDMVKSVQRYAPGYRLKQQVQFERITPDAGVKLESLGTVESGLKVSVFLEVEGAAHYLPAYAGNLDIMTSAALHTAEHLVAMRQQAVSA